VGLAVDGIENDRNVARFNQRKSIGLGVVQQSDANMVEVVERVQAELAEAEEDFPPGLEYAIASNDSIYVKESVNDLTTTIFMATLLVALVILVFLGSLRGTLISAISIPTSLLAGMALIFYAGFSLNNLSLLAFILVVGLVVDDAIVVLESCYRHMEYGAESKPAARTGTTEIAFAAIANTLALIAVFVPVAFMPGMIGRFFFEFGMTVAFTVVSSTFTALTLTPMLCSRYLRLAQSSRRPLFLRATEWGFARLESVYRFVLNRALKWRSITVLIAVAAFAAGIYFLSGLRSELVPTVDRSKFMIAYETVEGATITNTDKYGSQIEDILADIEEIRSFFMAIGMARSGPGKVNEGIFFIRMVDRSERERHQVEVMQEIREKMARIPGVRGYALELQGPGGGGEAPLQVVLKNPDINELARQQEAVMQWMRGQPEFVGVRSNMKLDKPEIRVSVNREKSQEMGITVAEISNTLRYIFGEPDITEIDRQGERYEVIPEIESEHNVPDTINRLYIRNQSGRMVSLANLVEIEEGVGPSEIHHFNRGRALTISSQLPPGVALGTALNKLQNFLDTELPADFSTDITGQTQDFREAFFYLTVALVFAVIFIFLIMAGQFESFLHPLTILMALPLAGIGAFGALYALNMTMNIFSFIGIIMLLGLVTKNAILLVDYANVLVARGYSVLEAARNAGMVRFRPVLMTAISTILGIMPIALGYGAGGEARMPMGIAICAGMFAATALTLLVIPVVYTLFDALQRKILAHRGLSALLALVLAAAAGALYFLSAG
jgi:hydrophobe/amphiphile efflux-1 (HAE1) family protein